MSDIALESDDLHLERLIDEHADAPVGEAPTVRPAPSAEPRVRFSIVRTLNELEELEEGWNALFERAAKCSNLFQSFNWNWHWARIFASHNTSHRSRQSQLAIVTAHAGDDTVLIFPLVLTRHMGTQILQWTGDPVSQYGDILLDPAYNRQDVLFQTWQFITTTLQPDLFVLRKVRDDASITPALRKIGARVSETNRAPYLDMSDASSFTEYEKRYTAKNRKNRRRHRKRLAEHGNLTEQHYSQGPDAAQHVAQAITFKREWLKARGLTSRAFCDNRTEHFLMSVAGDKSRPVNCLVSVLNLNGRPVAVDVGFTSGRRIAAHINSYDLNFVRHSPGSILLEDSLSHCIKSGYKTYDLMAPDDNYKQSWADYAISVYDFVLPITARGHAHDRLYIGTVRRGLTMIAKHTPKRVRRVISPVTNALSKKV